MKDPYQPPEDERPEGSAQDGEPRFPPFTLWRSGVWMFTGLLTFVVFILVYGLIDKNVHNDTVAQVFVGACAFFTASAMLIAQYPAGPRLGHALGLRPTHPAAVFVGLLLGVTAKFPVEKINQWVLAWMPYDEKQQEAVEGVLVAGSTVHAVGIAVAIALLAPFAEEVFFRGAVFGALRRNQESSFAAAAATTLGFVLVHVQPQMMIPIIPVAVILGLLRSASGSLIPCIAAHVGFNMMSVLGSTLEVLPPFEQLSPFIVQGATLACVVLVGVVLTSLRAHPAARESRAREMRVESAEGPRDA